MLGLWYGSLTFNPMQIKIYSCIWNLPHSAQHSRMGCTFFVIGRKWSYEFHLKQYPAYLNQEVYENSVRIRVKWNVTNMLPVKLLFENSKSHRRIRRTFAVESYLRVSLLLLTFRVLLVLSVGGKLNEKTWKFQTWLEYQPQDILWCCKIWFGQYQQGVHLVR